jgi:site-specific DNA-methyltransferase (adenine-specific)
MARETINKNSHLIDVWKLFLPVAGSGRERERSGMDLVLGPPIVGEPGSVCTQTYLVAGPLGSEGEAQSVESYLRTRLAVPCIASQAGPTRIPWHVPLGPRTAMGPDLD